MKNTQLKKLLSLTISIVLIAAMALTAVGCGNKDTNTPDPVSSSSAPVSETPIAEVKTVGEGATVFDFTVVDTNGNETKFAVKTDKTTVGEALLDAGLIDGEDGAYGLYVKTVNGTTLDYDTDGKYWAFYVNGEYASSGVDSTNIEAGSTYTFKAE